MSKVGIDCGAVIREGVGHEWCNQSAADASVPTDRKGARKTFLDTEAVTGLRRVYPNAPGGQWTPALPLVSHRGSAGLSAGVVGTGLNRREESPRLDLSGCPRAVTRGA